MLHRKPCNIGPVTNSAPELVLDTGDRRNTPGCRSTVGRRVAPETTHRTVQAGLLKLPIAKSQHNECIISCLDGLDRALKHRVRIRWERGSAASMHIGVWTQISQV